MSSTQEIKKVIPDSVNSFWVFLTVPHENCPEENSNKHLCDTFAKSASECLYNASFQIEKTNTTILKPFIPTDTPRTVCDLNRRYCNMDKPEEGDARENIYRQQVTKFVSNKKHNVQFILDVHSYPESTRKWRNYLLVVIDDSEKPKDYTLNFVNFMWNEANIKTLLQRGNGNDLHVQMRELGKKSMLLEFNEELKKDQNKLKQICRTIAFWFTTLET